MKKIIAVMLAMVMAFSLVALPVSAASRAILNGVCTQCGKTAQKVYFDEDIKDHYYTSICLEYFEPHYHTSFYRTTYIMCKNLNCSGNGLAVYLSGPTYYDICHYND